MHQPEGFKVKEQEHKVLRLHHALYGLKQAALSWWRELEASMKRLGFGCTMSDADVFFTKKEGQLVIAVVYVDNALFFRKNKEAIKRVEKTFMDIWECRDLGEARKFLRMKIRREGQKNLFRSSRLP